MIEQLRPWAGLGLSAVILWSGARMVFRPGSFAGIGLIPASDPRTVRAFGFLFLVIGVANAGLNFSYFVSE